MAMLKCRMCGGEVVVVEGRSCGTCDHCGSAMTLPRVSDERRLNLFNRADHFRRLNEFDRAVAAYESLLNEDNADAEAHWGLVLSRFGIEYVEDPKTRERLPTCHRVQSDSILRDTDYRLALEHAADSGARALYERQGAQIAEIQKGLLALSAQEEPYDIFICYKESSDGGSRTRDSVLAQDIYHHLTQEKYRVFFARISLENRLGQAYEPCIFAALNSARVMVVVGTKAEHFDAVWVRNEWSRFLSLRKKDSRKLIIPCYREMNPYDLPEDLSGLQSQDMEKIGFIQDLVRGIKKVLEDGKPAAAAVVSTSPTVNSEVAALVKRARLFLEDGDFSSADGCAEKALDKDPENADAYVAKLMVALRFKTEEQLASGTDPLTANSLYQKALRFSSGSQKQRIEGYNQKRLAEAERQQRRNAERWVRVEYRSQAEEWDEVLVEKVPTGEVDRVEVTEQETYWEEEVRPGGWFRKEARTRVQKTRPKVVVKEVPRMQEVRRTIRRKGPDVMEWTFSDGLGNRIPRGEAYEGYGIPVVFLPPGTFMMGSPRNEPDRESGEVLHTVTLSRPFALAQTQCTQGQWESVMRGNPSDFKGSDRPVEQVSWEEAVEYCRKLTAKQRAEGILPDGWEWRLPTESEWEYAARAGTTGARYGELDAIAWHYGNSGSETHAVGGKQANAWGLYDMMGNVWEWCADWSGDYPTGSVTDPTGPSSGSSRVFRGGSWDFVAGSARSAFRRWNVPGSRSNYLGFRPALSSVR